MKHFAHDWIQVPTEYLELCGLPLYLNALADDDGLVLLDSGVADTPHASITGELAAAGLRIQDVRLVVNSHAHPDHMGGNGALRELADPQFAAPAAEAGWLESNERVLSELWEPNPDAMRLSDDERAELRGLLGERVRIDHLLRDGDALDVAGSALTVVTTSGHSPGHIAVHDQGRGVLFTFDDVQGAGVPLAHSDLWLAPLYHDVDRYLGGLHRLAALDFEMMVPAHGEHLPRDEALERIAASVAFVQRAEEFVGNAVLGSGEVRLAPLAQALGTELGDFGGITLQTMSVAKAHLDHLVRGGSVVPVWRSIERERE